MGKRELLLLLAFLAFGAIVYQATAPAPDPKKEGFSFSRFVGQMKAEIKGEQAETVVERTNSADAPSGEGRLVVPEFRGTISILGEDRGDLAAQLKATVYGMDDDQAKERARDLTIAFNERGDDVDVEITMPHDMRRRPLLELTLRVPKHLGVTLELRGGQADIRRVGQIRLQNARGKVTMAEVGDVDGGLDMGTIEIVHARNTDLKLRRTKAQLEEIAGELKLEAGYGELRIQQLHGPAELTLERLDCEIDSLHGPMRIHPDRVHLSVRNVAAPLIVKGQHTEVIATLLAAEDVSIETTDEQIDFRAPKQGVTIDASTENGQIRVADSGDQIEEHDSGRADDVEQPEQPERGRQPPPPPDAHAGRRQGEPNLSRSERRRGDRHESHTQHTRIKLHGGGPTIMLRNTRGDIVIR